MNVRKHCSLWHCAGHLQWTDFSAVGTRQHSRRSKVLLNTVSAVLLTCLPSFLFVYSMVIISCVFLLLQLDHFSFNKSQGVVLCVAYDHTLRSIPLLSTGDWAAVTFLSGTDNTPLYAGAYWSGFSAFRV